MKQNWKNKIYYSQCWEDPDVLREGLIVSKNDKVVSVTSGGCNTLALLLDNPDVIFAIDINKAQNYLLELKIQAITYLEHEELLSFLGITASSDRLSTYKKLESGLSDGAKIWWKNNHNLIKNGIIHAGKFEKYLGIFRKIILRLIHSKQTTADLFTKRESSEQKKFYEKVWNTWRWRFFFYFFFSKTVIKLLGRNPALFSYVDNGNLAGYYFNKTQDALSTNPSENFFLQYIFFGTYPLNCLPQYLRRENISLIKEQISKIKIISLDTQSFLNSSKEKYSKYNLSNIFESLSIQETNTIFESIIQNSTKESRLVYINHLVPRSFSEPKDMIRHLPIEKELNEKNKAFFYKFIHIDEIIKI